MEIKADFLGINATLKLCPVWHLFSQASLYIESQFFILKVGHYLHMLFEQTVHFCKNIFCMIFLRFIIAKGLAMSRLGGVISTQIVQFRALFIAGFMHFLLLIVFNNSIDTLGPGFITDHIFVAIFSSLAG